MMQCALSLCLLSFESLDEPFGLGETGVEADVAAAVALEAGRTLYIKHEECKGSCNGCQMKEDAWDVSGRTTQPSAPVDTDVSGRSSHSVELIFEASVHCK
jgi:hypothetical protein